MINPPGQFEGSVEGAMLELEPGNYNIEEITHANGDDQLITHQNTEDFCVNNQNIVDGGLFFASSGPGYNLCFEYEDENGQDCSSIELQAGDDKTCTIKNYISASNTTIEST